MPRFCLKEVAVSRWVKLSAFLLLFLAGCYSDKPLVLQSTPADRAISPAKAYNVANPAKGGDLADHSRRDWARVAPISDRLDPMGAVTRITVHHSGDFNDMNSEEQIVAHLQAVQSSQCRSKSAANKGNIGICVLGNFDVQYPNDRQKQSLKALLVRLMDRYGLANTDIYTHREIRADYGLAGTDCPGTHLQPVVDSLRRGSLGGSGTIARASRR